MNGGEGEINLHSLDFGEMGWNGEGCGEWRGWFLNVVYERR